MSSDRIPFAHIRNVRVFDNGDFIETSHRTEDGTVDISGIVQAYHDNGFTGYVRPITGGISGVSSAVQVTVCMTAPSALCISGAVGCLQPGACGRAELKEAVQ